MAILNVGGELFYIQRFLLNFGGVWPLYNRSYVSRIVFTITLVLEITAVLTIAPLDGRGEHFFYWLTTVIFIINMIAAHITFRIRGQQMISLIESAIDDWRATTDPTELDIMKGHNEFGTLLFSVTFIYIVGIDRIMEMSRLPVIKKIVVLLREKTVSGDFFTFEDVIIILPVIWGIWCGTMVYGGSLLFWSFAMHLSAQLQILKKRFQTFLLINDKTESRRQLRFLVDRHNQILESIKTLESAFNVFVATRTIGTHIIACTDAYCIITDINSNTKTAWHVGSLVMILWLQSANYYAGDYLTTCCEEIGEVFTECDWYDLSRESIRNFSIIILRSRMSKTVTVASFYRLNLLNYKYVTQAVYSYMSLILTVAKIR